MTPTEEHLDPLAIELACVGEMSEDTRAHLAQCATCRQSVDILRAQAEAFTAKAPFKSFAAQPAVAAALKKAESPPPSRPRRAKPSRWMVAGLAMAASLALFAVLTEPSPPPNALRFKGGSSVQAVRLRGGQTSRHVDLVPVQAGDRLRFKVHLIGDSHVRAVLVTPSGYRLTVDSKDRSSGTHIIPNDAIVVTDPVEPATLQVVVEPKDGNVERWSLQVVPE